MYILPVLSYLQMPPAVPSNATPPQELVFHVDERVLKSIDSAKQDYLKQVS